MKYSPNLADSKTSDGYFCILVRNESIMCFVVHVCARSYNDLKEPFDVFLNNKDKLLLLHKWPTGGPSSSSPIHRRSPPSPPHFCWVSAPFYGLRVPCQNKTTFNGMEGRLSFLPAPYIFYIFQNPPPVG